MARRIDWMYHRRGCPSCEKTQGYLESVAGTVKETINADKARLGPADVLELLKKVIRVVATRGKQVVEFDLKSNRPDDETLLMYLLGRTGNLRAPSALVGKTLVVGFNPEAYQKVLGG